MGAEEEQPPWSRARIAAVSLVVFAVLMGTALLLSRPAGKTGHGAAASQLEISPANANGSLLEQLALEQPDWLARPGSRMFASNLAPHEFFRANLEPEWTEFNASPAGRLLATHLRANQPITALPLEKPVPSTEPVFAPGIMLIATSRLVLTGALTNRALWRPARLRSWTNADVLPPSVVQVSVNPAGMVLHARLLRSSRLRAADQAALGQARAARFKSLPGAETNLFLLDNLATGEMVFRWHTVASGVTNTLELELPARTVLPR